MPVADRGGNDLPRADAVLVEEALQRVEHEQWGTAVTLRLLLVADDVVRCDRGAHGPKTYLDRNLACAAVSLISMPRLRTVTLILLVSLLLAGLAAAPGALASHSQVTYFEGSSELLEESSRPNAFAQLQRLGVRALRIELYWASVVPSRDSATRPSFDATDPANYYWAPYDAVLSEAQRLHWPVLLTVTSPVPRWATSNKKAPYVTRPDPQAFQEFMTAVGAPLRLAGVGVLDLERGEPSRLPAAAVELERHARLAADLPRPLPGRLRRAAGGRDRPPARASRARPRRPATPA